MLQLLAAAFGAAVAFVLTAAQRFWHRVQRRRRRLTRRLKSLERRLNRDEGVTGDAG